jgi:IclR family acetate operon transcriptional repressor
MDARGYEKQDRAVTELGPEVGAGHKSAEVVKTLEKSLRILELLLTARSGLSINEIAVQTRTHRASVHRLLTSLHVLGWVDRPSSRPIYRASLRFYALARVFVQNYGVVERLEPLLTELSALTHETAHLGVLDGFEVLHIGRVESPERVGVASRLGSRGWAHTSGMGKALLAAQPDDVLERYIVETGLPEMTVNSFTDPDALRGEIALVRQRGFAVDNEEDAIGVRCLGTTLPAPNGAPVLAVSITGPSPRLTLEDALRFGPMLVRRVADAGYFDDEPREPHALPY